MADNKIINVGDVCTYSYDNKNKSLSMVEVVKELSDECVAVKFHQVIVDDSGNDLFTYLCNSGKTMNVSRKYLHKIDLINRQKAEIERLNKIINIILGKYDGQADEWANIVAFERATAIKKFAEGLKEKGTLVIGGKGFEGVYVMCSNLVIDNLAKEMVGDSDEQVPESIW